MAEKIVDYVRCPNCSYVYEATKDECPQCHKPTVINESQLDQEIFNLNDQILSIVTSKCLGRPHKRTLSFQLITGNSVSLFIKKYTESPNEERK